MPEREAQLFAAMFRGSPIGMALVSLQGGFMTVNEALCRMLGYAQAELLALTFQDITHPEDLGSDLALLRRVLAREIDQYELRKRYRRKDGQLIWIALHVSLILDEDGAPAFFCRRFRTSPRRWRPKRSCRTFMSGCGWPWKPPRTASGTGGCPGASCLSRTRSGRSWALRGRRP
ncbi:PAS domain S-box protein [Deinococcus multiflagellatus]|uniref:histidine kinase n=1 Tax=Deinococcus multiflagellatus TaxID=1656887 RepID=A0ABW1ZR26_9DEIO